VRYFLFLLAACAPDPKDAAATCTETRSALSGADATTPLGLTPQDVLDLGAGAFGGVLTWADRSETALTLGIDAGETLSAWFVDSQPVAGADGANAELAALCAPRVEVDVTVLLTTDDGRLGETLTAPLVAFGPDVATVRADLAAPRGSLDLSEFVDPGFTDVDAPLVITGRGDGRSDGVLEAVATYDTCEDDDGLDCSTSATTFDVATWSASAR
jgi:hypothetical protein